MRTLPLLNLAGFLFMITLNVLANALPLFGRNTGEISAFYPNLFVPAGFTFSIWGIIYLLLLVFTVAQFRRQADELVSRLGPWYLLSGLANGLWIVVWHALLPLGSLAIMLVLLATLIVMYQRLLPFGEWKYVFKLPISVYLGWISVATIANTTAVLVHYGWQGGGLPESFWTILMIGVAVVAGLFFLWKFADVPYVLVIIWALYGILSKTTPDAIAIKNVLLGALGLLGLAAAWRFPRWLKA
jgi:translocator protein